MSKVSWVLGIVFLFGAMGGILSGSFIAGALYLIVACILLPPTTTYLKEKKNFELSGIMKVIVIIILLCLVPTTEEPSNNSDVVGDNSETQIKTNELSAESVVTTFEQPPQIEINETLNKEVTETSTQTIQEETTKAMSREYVSVDFYDLYFDFVSSYSELTDFQKEEQFKEYEGKYINGSGIVKDVDTVFLSDDILVKIMNPENEFLTAGRVYFKSSEKEGLLNIGVYDDINFEGRIDGYSAFSGITIKDAELI